MKTIITLIISTLFLSLGTAVAQRGNGNKHNNRQQNNSHQHRHTKVQNGRATTHNRQRSPQRGTRTATVSRSSVSINFGNVRYRCDNGVYYRPRGREFVVVRAPIGIRINTLPVGHRRMVINSRPYFYYSGDYYVRNSVNQYEVVNAPLGAEVDMLPIGYDIITLNNQEFYRYDNVYYEPRINRYNEEYYVIVSNPMNRY